MLPYSRSSGTLIEIRWYLYAVPNSYHRFPKRIKTVAKISHYGYFAAKSENEESVLLQLLHKYIQ